MIPQGLGTTNDSVPRPRIQTLSDMIFGLALSIGAISLLTQKPGSVVDITYAMFSFGFSFVILALVWLKYSRIMSALPVDSGGIVAANMLLLFLVSVEPYLYNLMNISSYTPGPGQLNSAATTTLYALDLGALMIILAYFMHELTIEERQLIPRKLLRGFRLEMNTTIVIAAIFLLSSLPIFWNVVVIQVPTVPLRYVMWSGVSVTAWGKRLVARATGC